MPTLVCNTCNVVFCDEAAQKKHYRTDWHQYNLRRKVAGLPGVTEALFKLRCEALEAEKQKGQVENFLYICVACNREYKSHKAHIQHISSKSHIQKVSILQNQSSVSVTVVRPAPNLVENIYDDDSGSSEEWVEVPDAYDSMSLDGADANLRRETECMSNDCWDPCQCFFCDRIPDGTVGGCIEHMHKQHGFFIPDIEYLKDCKGMLSYLGLKVTKGHICLYCEEQGKKFQSLDAVRKHMISKSHCKLRYGEDGQDEELEEFYDYTSSYLPDVDAQLVSAEEPTDQVSLSTNGSELVVKCSPSNQQNSMILGCREFKIYYQQRPRPTNMQNSIALNALVSRYKSTVISTKQSQKSSNNFKKLAYPEDDSLRLKLGMKNNILKNLPKNVTY